MNMMNMMNLECKTIIMNYNSNRIYSKIPNTLNNLSLFYNSNTRDNNDKNNKIREKCIVEMFNNLNNIKHINTKNKQLNKLYNNLIKCIDEICDNLIIKYYNRKLKLIAGGKNFDFELNCYCDGKIITMKLEFKYGTLKIKNIPQFHSPFVYSGGISAIVKSDTEGYHEYFFAMINKFIDCFPPNISYKLKQHVPKTQDEYNNIMNSVPQKGGIYSNKFLQLIYDYRNNPIEVFEPDIKVSKLSVISGLKFQNYVKTTIKTYIESINIYNIDFVKVNNTIKKQNDKHFILCLEGIFKYARMKQEDFVVKPDIMNKKNNNTLVFSCVNESNKIHALLRWRNTHGCSNPMFQISVK